MPQVMDSLPTFSNPVTDVTIPDWPFGRQRCRAHFWIETTTRGQRCCRKTENKTRTGWNKPVKLTYAKRSVIVTGDDDKLYILRDHDTHVNVMRGTMKEQAGNIWSNWLGERSPEEQAAYADAMALLDAGSKTE